MPNRKNSSGNKQPVKRLLDDVGSKKAVKCRIVVRQLPNEDDATQSQLTSSVEVTSASSSTLNNREDGGKRDVATSPNPYLLNAPTSSTRVEMSLSQQQRIASDRGPVSANSDFLYSPINRLYFGMNPPNPRLYNEGTLQLAN
ncbi:unnamed protein product [Adineta ricciae]|uniref:Uncharacterized protein n=1 Tax=Adineta ricciae TaxID=249248 RepID=A0A816EQP5_ADIRI|nr:unnamed protein product [Adineta ricciae]